MLLLLACAPSTTPQDSPTPEPTDTAADPLTLDNLSVSVHPEIGSILVVSWDQSATADTWVEYKLDGEPVQVTPTTLRDAGAQEQLVIGVPYDTDVHLRVVSADTSTDTTTAHTDPLPETVPVPELSTLDSTALDPADRWLLIGLSSGGEDWQSDGFWKLILDRQGRVVWAHETPDGYRSFYVQPSLDGTHILWDECTFWTDFDEGAASTVHRMTLDGTVSATIPVPGLHHAFLDLGDDTIAWGGIDAGREVLRERTGTGEAREIWDCSAYWEDHGSVQSCDGNALSWDPDTGAFLYSSDAGNSIAEVDRASGDVLRTFGRLDDAYAFVDGTLPFSKQHGPNWTEDGTLLLSAWTSDANHQIVAREYAVDADARTMHEVWTCGDGTNTTGEYAGEAHRLANGNTLLNYGEGGEIREYTPACEEVWHLDWPYANLLGRAVFLADLYPFLP